MELETKQRIMLNSQRTFISTYHLKFNVTVTREINVVEPLMNINRNFYFGADEFYLC